LLIPTLKNTKNKITLWGLNVDTIKISPEELERLQPTKEYYIESEIPAGGKGYALAKRIFDIVLSVIGLIIIFPFALILSIIICIDSKGGPLYIQDRLGRDGKTFHLIKFRTMVSDAESEGAKWAEENDPRCTKIGRILRKCRIDEVPQLLNILSGDMSFVGPRPEREIFYDQFETYIHGFRNRLSVIPGLTGLAQTSGGYDLTPEEKIVYDMEYIKTRSFWLDIKLMFRTVKLVFTHEGAR